jgi:hypothetical protein
MVKQILISVVSSVLGALAAFLGSAAFGLYEKSISASQVEDVASTLVNREAHRDVILTHMANSGRFVGERGETGEQGPPGPRGVFLLGTEQRLPLSAWHKAEANGFLRIGTGSNATATAAVSLERQKSGIYNRTRVTGGDSSLLLVRRGEYFWGEGTPTDSVEMVFIPFEDR